ncbi:2-desacetyl-2-hydroxyethyl bacteriochlorophyllide A dehydrogenase [Anaerovirgula multivorans]|uniref:2-desacetyl-2-hydroxyethyl bacteriochlorophyllide A dehydrogenase n=1 Tax=Anaerovirgula multivorans TaxID=312168 RepID=A0A239CHC2_9FIRM|nr:zinc-binding alcohol dehydrogenase family protein [Anaerovirgula multivorans]SNS18743.1 2-desacetyl-2-hydroxyethyl bacteriochlorophyllide A dehydrogenase [Anaerovirgula multivorans]
MKMMKVVEIKEPGRIQVVEKEIPKPKKGEALLKIKYCGICGSDIATYTGNQPFASYPRIPGHEFSAEIIEVEDNNLGLQKGMIVTANPYFNCGSCYSCQKGKVNCCESNETMGVQRDGSFAEYLTMPIERIYNGKTLSAKTLALIEPFSISYHAINRGDIQKEDKVLVFGAGAIGIFAMIAAKLRGAQVYITDVFEDRLKQAMQMGADGIINASKEDINERVKEITEAYGMDVCIEAAGLPETFLNCIDSVAFGGKVVLIGNGKRETAFNHSVLLKKELNVYGSRNSLLNDFLSLIDLVTDDKVDIEKIVTDVFELHNVIDAFESLKNNDGSKLKVLVKFD